MKKSIYCLLLFSTAITPLIADFFSDQEEKKTKFTAILEQYEAEVQRDPDNLSLILSVAEVYLSLKNYPKAVEYYKKGLALKPDNKKIQLDLAQAYLNNKDLTHSDLLFQQILKEEPRNSRVLEGIGRIQALKHNLSEAENYYTQALNIDPDQPTTLFYYAELKIDQRKYLEAEAILTKLLEENPQAEWLKTAMKKAKFGPVLEKAAEYRQKGDYPAIYALLNEQLKADPDNLEAYLALARAYTENKQYSDALDTLQKGFTKFPKESSLSIAEGFTYIALNNLDQAASIFNTVIHNEGPQFEAEAGLGRIAYLRGNPQEAEEHYQNAIELNPYDTIGFTYLAQLKMEQKDFDAAVKLYARVLELDQNALWARQGIDEAKIGPVLDLVNRALLEKDYKSAESLYQDLLEQFPENVSNYLRFAKFYRSQRQYLKAIETTERGLRINFNSAPLQVSLGFDYLAIGNYEQGLAEFLKVLERDPQNADATAGIGRVEELMGNREDAVMSYQLALELDPKNVTALIFLANLKMDMGEYETAKDLYIRLSKVQPSAKWVKFAIQDAKHGPLLKEIHDKVEAKDLIAAQALWQQLIQEESSNPDYYLRFGQFYHGIKNYEKAIDTYLKGIALDPDSSELQASLGLVYLSTKEYTKAESAFQQALKINPLNPDALAGLGNVQMVHEQYEEAEKLMKTALGIDPDSVAALSSYGDLMMKLHRYTEAQATYEKLLALRPEEKWIRLSLDDAAYGKERDQIKDLIDGEKFSEAADIFRTLLEKSPDNPRFYFGLGQ
ncbi:MAG: tetratricopeptide repeat protein, partial [Parachlamydiaceae bacterium]